MRSNTTQEKFPLVGVGASAGGIDSFKKFLKAVPPNSGMAYILVQHLSASHESILPEILSRSTTIPVQSITDDCEVEPDHIYVIPENKILEVTDHWLKLSPRKKNTPNMPIDLFFISLAKVHGAFAIGVVLSGTARDGTVGLREIKEHGGLTFAEDPRSATWEGMPKNAIEAGVVDFVLPVEEIPSKLIQVYSLYGTASNDEVNQKSVSDKDHIKKILSVVEQHSGVDFSYYKEPTILRRINRRLAICQMEIHSDYLEFLRVNKTEQESLFQDLLIKVTSFFRDPEVFEELGKTVFPKFLEDHGPDTPIRIWIPACSTGEEAYSLAIGLFDAFGGLTAGYNLHRTKIQIFATDISKTAINKARTGIYSPSEVKPLSEWQLEDYFIKTDGNYQVVKPIRDTIVFSIHNFLKDPPFGRLDLVSCRNVFIYLDPFLQKKVLATFHYALQEHGYLLIGRSESIGTPSDLFVPYSKGRKIYSRKPGSGRFLQVSHGSGYSKKIPIRAAEISTRASQTDFLKSAESTLISKYTPVGVIVDGHMEVVHIKGSIAPFLEPYVGKPGHELMKMVHKELAFELRTAIHKAKESLEPVIKEGIPMKIDREEFSVTIEIVPLNDIVDPYYLILFQKKSGHSSFLDRTWEKLKPTFTSLSKNNLQKHIASMERELEQARDDMRVINEDQDAYNEELQSANEEMLSSNEEMQSLNEELETSKEELQSINEEIILVNRELLEKQEEQNVTMDYLNAVIANLREPFVVLQSDFTIQSANASYYKRFNVNKNEIEGRHFFKVQDKIWDNPELHFLLQNVLPQKERIVDEEIVLQSPSGGEWTFMFNAREIVRDTKYGKSILLSIEDVTARKMTESYKNTIAKLNENNHKLDRYVHMASHELQEPLENIINYSDRLIKKGAFGAAEDQKILKKIASSAEGMSSLVTGLLDYARLSQYGGPFEQTDLNKVLEDTQLDLKLLIEQKRGELKIGPLPVLDAVPLQMQQLFYNLVGNAFIFSREGVPPVVEILSRPFPKKEIEKYPTLLPQRSYHELIIRDNGIGFNQKQGEQLFLIFQRLGQHSDYAGSGIGLSIAKKITDNHNGEIFAVSEKEKGAAFHVILPANQEA
ncbi:Protein-glutamate methylesterase/protein-glutamine glutaminase [Arenibacter antarcticus]|uniref:Chemotaxis protein CheB n=1 Tax=Arenibacter antarcticus TaxID=2040469 RepID=A0ABW5VF41_9FLAO|nr:chemotaxis protein CheB [Arenibacter sp. H213]MCM4166321.1 hypothetical protein [Arenibacter sp. H213]